MIEYTLDPNNSEEVLAEARKICPETTLRYQYPFFVVNDSEFVGDGCSFKFFKNGRIDVIPPLDSIKLEGTSSDDSN